MTQDSGQPPPSEPTPPDEKTHPADALDALARGDSGQSYPCPQCGQANPLTALYCATCGNALSPQDVRASDGGADRLAGSIDSDVGHEDLELVPLADDAPVDLSGDLAEMAEATGPAPGRRQVKYRPQAGLPPVWRYAIPPMAAMAVLMFAITGWAIAVLGGAAWFVDDPSTPLNRLRAMIMLLTLPVGLFLLFGCYVIWRDQKQQSSRPGLGPQRGGRSG